MDDDGHTCQPRCHSAECPCFGQMGMHNIGTETTHILIQLMQCLYIGLNRNLSAQARYTGQLHAALVRQSLHAPLTLLCPAHDKSCLEVWSLKPFCQENSV